MRPDYLVVGTGLTGAVIARTLADAGLAVLAVERREHPGGNVRDEVHPSGIRVHSYGPHYFRTSSERIWKFVGRFARFYPYQARVRSRVGDREESWPVSAAAIRRLLGREWTPEPAGPADSFEAAVLRTMPREAYDLFVREYTEKQWGVPAATLSAKLARRFSVRADEDPRFTPAARFQGIPEDGYAAWVERMLEPVPVLLGFDYLRDPDVFRPRLGTVFTGPIDEFFGFRLGRLRYRGQRRETTYLPDVDRFQSVGQVNEPQHAAGPHIRTLEWKQMMPPEQAAACRGTVVTRETPFTPDDPDGYEYPFPDAENEALYARYRALAAEREDVLICGRLGEYRYYDMDQAIGRALVLARGLLARCAR